MISCVSNSEETRRYPATRPINRTSLIAHDNIIKENYTYSDFKKITEENSESKPEPASRMVVVNNIESPVLDANFVIDNSSATSRVNMNIIGKLNIALLLPMTGANKQLGKEYSDTAVFALQDMDTNKIEVSYFDTKSTDVGLVDAIKEISRGDFDVIVGPTFSKDVKLVVEEMKKYDKKIPIISLSNDRSIKASNVLIFGYSVNDAIDDMVALFVSKNMKNFVAIFPNNIQGSADFKVFKQAISKHEANLMRAEFYDNIGVANVSKYVSKITSNLREVEVYDKLTMKKLDAGRIAFDSEKHIKREKTANVFYISAYGGELRKILAAMSDSEFAKPDDLFIVAHSGSEDDSISLNKNLDGVNLFSHGEYRDYVTKFYGQYGYKPSKLSSILYDAILFSSYLKTKRDKINYSDIKDGSFNFDGVNGSFEISDGYLKRRNDLVHFTQTGIEKTNLDITNSELQRSGDSGQGTNLEQILNNQ